MGSWLSVAGSAVETVACAALLVIGIYSEIDGHVSKVAFMMLIVLSSRCPPRVPPASPSH